MRSLRIPALFVCVLASLIVGPAALAARAAGASPKPNIVIILIDDMGYGDIEPFGSKLNRTPNLNRMAAEGMKLTSFYAAPVCTPSRAQLLTGCYAKRVGLPDVLFPDSPIGISAKEHTIAELLKKQGYATMAIGKWHVGDQPEFLPTRHGFDHYLGLPYSNDMGGEWDGAPDVSPGKRKPPLPLVRDGKVIATLTPPDQDRLTEMYTDEALKFIRSQRQGPFFLYLAHTAVHVPLHPGRAFRGTSRNGTYGDWVQECDASTGRVLDELRKLKIAESTFVFFTSDNGPWLIQGKDGGTAGPLRGGKGGTYEGGMREPTIVWWPGHVPAGSSSDTIAGEIDLLPTLVDLAGGSVPTDNFIDGADILPLLLGKAHDSPRRVQFYFNGNRLEAVRMGPWKLAIAPQRENNGIKPPPQRHPFQFKLYNLDKDIGETTDVAETHMAEVRDLQRNVAAVGFDLGIIGAGPGVRAPGRVGRPKPLLLHPK